MIETWYGIVSFMLITYVVLDGRNFGAGMLHWLVAKTPDQRRQVRPKPLFIVPREQPDSPMTKLLTAFANFHCVHCGTAEEKVDRSPQEHFPPLGFLGVVACRSLQHRQSLRCGGQCRLIIAEADVLNSLSLRSVAHFAQGLQIIEMAIAAVVSRGNMIHLKLCPLLAVATAQATKPIP